MKNIEFIGSTNLSFNKYLLGSWNVLDTVLSAGIQADKT